MSIRANPTAIGLFMIGATVLTVGGTATLASTAWFDKQTKFISFFPESVNGLENGAPVKFQGVPVGAVTALGIQIDQRDKTFQVLPDAHHRTFLSTFCDQLQASGAITQDEFDAIKRKALAT